MSKNKAKKGMLIGQSGSRLKSIGTASRKELEELLDSKVMLKIWVKVKSGWSDNESVLPSMGYESQQIEFHWSLLLYYIQGRIKKQV